MFEAAPPPLNSSFSHTTHNEDEDEEALFMTNKKCSGRKRDDLYCYFGVVDDTAKNKRVICMYCNVHMNQNRERMLKHLKNCDAATKDVKEYANRMIEEKVNKNADVSESLMKKQKLTPSAASSVCSSTASTGGIKNYFMPPLSKNEYHMYSDQLVYAMIACNIPWSLLDNERFRAAMGHLRPQM